MTAQLQQRQDLLCSFTSDSVSCNLVYQESGTALQRTKRTTSILQPIKHYIPSLLYDIFMWETKSRHFKYLTINLACWSHLLCFPFHFLIGFQVLLVSVLLSDDKLFVFPFHCSSGVPIPLYVPVGCDMSLCLVLELLYFTLRLDK